MKLKCIFFVMILFLGACSRYDPTFVQVVSDHRQVTGETVDVLLDSIQADMQKRPMSESELKSVQNLIDHLTIMKRGSVLIEKYVMMQASKEELAAALKHQSLQK